MKDISDVWFVAGSRNAIRPSLHTALRAAHEFWINGGVVIAVIAMGSGLRLDPDAIVQAWRELGLPAPATD